MSILILAEHDNAALNPATAKAVTAAKVIGGDIHVLVAGSGAQAVADQAAKLDGVAKDDPIILYCRSGARSNTCGMILQQAGYTNLTNGINEHHVRQLLSRG